MPIDGESVSLYVLVLLTMSVAGVPVTGTERGNPNSPRAPFPNKRMSLIDTQVVCRAHQRNSGPKLGSH